MTASARVGRDDTRSGRKKACGAVEQKKGWEVVDGRRLGRREHASNPDRGSQRPIGESACEAIAVARPDEAAIGGQGGEAFIEGGVAYVAVGAQLGERHRLLGLGEGSCDALVE